MFDSRFWVSLQDFDIDSSTTTSNSYYWIPICVDEMSGIDVTTNVLELITNIWYLYRTRAPTTPYPLFHPCWQGTCKEMNPTKRVQRPSMKVSVHPSLHGCQRWGFWLRRATTKGAFSSHAYSSTNPTRELVCERDLPLDVGSKAPHAVAFTLHFTWFLAAQATFLICT